MLENAKMNAYEQRAEGAIERTDSWDAASVALAVLALAHEVRALREELQRERQERQERAQER